MRRRTPAQAGLSETLPAGCRQGLVYTSRAPGRRTLGGAKGTRPLSLRRQVADRRPVFVNPCSVCLSLTRPLGNRLPRSPRPRDLSGLTNGVRGRGPRLSGDTAGGAAPYVSAWGPALRGHASRDPHDPAQRPILRKACTSAPQSPTTPGRRRQAPPCAPTAARAGTSRAHPSRTSLTSHRRERTLPR